jgi:hypothetical protein
MFAASPRWLLGVSVVLYPDASFHKSVEREASLSVQIVPDVLNGLNNLNVLNPA